MQVLTFTHSLITFTYLFRSKSPISKSLLSFGALATSEVNIGLEPSIACLLVLGAAISNFSPTSENLLSVNLDIVFLSLEIHLYGEFLRNMPFWGADHGPWIVGFGVGVIFLIRFI